MILLATLLVVTVAISASLRLAGWSKKSSVLLASIPWAIANLVSLSALMILRTPEGRVISKVEQFLTGMLVPIAAALLVALLVKKKEPIQPPEPTSTAAPRRRSRLI